MEMMQVILMISLHMEMHVRMELIVLRIHTAGFIFVVNLKLLVFH